MIIEQRRAGAWALLPVKRPEGAKSRLASVLPLGERQALQRAMLSDVLKGVSDSRLLEGIAVVTPDRGSGEVARRRGAIHFPEPAGCDSLVKAVELGVRRLRDAGARIIAVIPADLPMLQGHELDRAIGVVREHDTVVVVPDRHGIGTNALIFPADSPPAFDFGPGSFQRHLAHPGNRGAIAMQLGSMELDLDTPTDLAHFNAMESSAAVAPRTHGVLTLALAQRERKLVCEDV